MTTSNVVRSRAEGREFEGPQRVSFNAWVVALHSAVDSLPGSAAPARALGVATDEYHLAEMLTPDQLALAWSELAATGAAFPEAATGDEDRRLTPPWFDAFSLLVTGETRLDIRASEGGAASTCRIVLDKGRAICVNRRRTVTELDDGTEVSIGVSPDVEILQARDTTVWEALASILPEFAPLASAPTGAPISSDGDPLELDKDSYAAVRSLMVHEPVLSAGRILKTLRLPKELAAKVAHPSSTVSVALTVRSRPRGRLPLEWGGLWVQTPGELFAIQPKDHISRDPIVQIRSVHNGHLARELFYALLVAHEYLSDWERDELYR